MTAAQRDMFQPPDQPPEPRDGLRAYQVEAVEAVREELREHRATLVLMSTGCHAAGQRVLMHSGHAKTVEAVEVGDELMGPDSLPRIVTALARGQDEMVDIVPVKGAPWRVNIGHILTLVKTWSDRSPMAPPSRRGGDVCDVSVRDWLDWSKTAKHKHKLFRVPVDFEDLGFDLTLDPYFVGVYIGDGCRPEPAVCSIDKAVINHCHQVAHGFGLTTKPFASGGRAPVWHMTGSRGSPNPLTMAMREIGITNRGRRFIPWMYKIASRQDRLDLLAGILDTDGSLDGAVFDFISKSSQLAMDVAFVARSLGLAAYVRGCKKASQNGTVGAYFRVCISGDVSVIPTRIPRKVASLRQQKKDVLRTGFSVHKTNIIDNFYGFSISGDGRYLLDDFTVTHNTGKTQVACELIRTTAGRCLFVAHRDELIQQACRRIEQFTGEWPHIEQAELRASNSGGRHVVASIQSLSRPNRLARFLPDEFELIVIDEVHHATSKTYRRVVDHFSGNIVGLTATPDRLDKQALGQVLDSVAYRYDILDAIRDGWLCDVVMRRVLVGSMDFSGIHTVAGDLNQAELEKLLMIEENLHAIAKPAVECSDGRKTIVFTSSVAHAERLAEIINRYAGADLAMVVHGKTPKDERRQLLREFHSGRWQYFVNVGIATEGYDEPEVSCIVMGRPTKSRALYTQMLGRGTRGGTQCRVEDKTDCLVLDFVGNTGKHEIVSAADVLGGEYGDKELELAKQIAEKSETPKTLDEAIVEARAEIEHERSEEAKRRRAHVIGDVGYTIQDYNPYVMFEVRRDHLTEKYGMAPATEKQVAAINRWMGKHHKHAPKNLSKHEASRLLAQFADRRQRGLASYGQVRFLATKGYDARSWAFGQASRVIDWIAKHGWQRPPASVVGSIVRERQPGED